MIEKIVKETFKPDVNEGLKKHINKIPSEDKRFEGTEKVEEKKDDKVIEEEPRGGVFVPEDTSEDFGKGAVIYQDVVDKKNKLKNGK